MSILATTFVPLLALAACGSGSSTQTPPSTAATTSMPPAGCHVSVSGSYSAELECAATLRYDAKTRSAVFGLHDTVDDGGHFMVNTEVHGEPGSRAYEFPELSSLVMTVSPDLHDGKTHMCTMASNAERPPATARLVLRSAGVQSTSSLGTLYEPHGSFEATCVPLPGTDQGPVKLAVTF